VNSNWSAKNCRHATTLIAERRMLPAGLAQVDAAKSDGRWDTAYAGSADMTIPQDFLDALEDMPAAKAYFATLDRRNLYSIYYRLHQRRSPRRAPDGSRKLLRNWIVAKSFTDPCSLSESVSHSGQMIGCTGPLVKQNRPVAPPFRSSITLFHTGSFSTFPAVQSARKFSSVVPPESRHACDGMGRFSFGP
jgi:Bacteriocin-protection, YdeI or OmpD-Associated